MEIERHNFRIGNRELFFDLKYSVRKTVGICVNPDSRIQVTAPEGTSMAQVLRVLERKAKWIAKQLEELERFEVVNGPKTYLSGQTIRLLGRDYMLKVCEIPEYEEEEIKKDHRIIYVNVRDRSQQARINLLIDDWYRDEALIYLAEKFEHCFKKISKYGISKPQYYLRYMDKRWGSCTPSGVIYLNPDIIQLPSHCIEYVIMHKLCHLKYRDHSKDYYHFLDTVMPDWEIRSSDLNSFFEV